MRRLVVLLMVLLCTSCVVPALHGPNFSRAPTTGMTSAEVRAQWGPPYRRAFVNFGGSRGEVWTYRSSYVIVTGFGRQRYYDSHLVQILDGKVIGTDW